MGGRSGTAPKGARRAHWRSPIRARTRCGCLPHLGNAMVADLDADLYVVNALPGPIPPLNDRGCPDTRLLQRRSWPKHAVSCRTLWLQE